MGEWRYGELSGLLHEPPVPAGEESSVSVVRLSFSPASTDLLRRLLINREHGGGVFSRNVGISLNYIAIEGRRRDNLISTTRVSNVATKIRPLRVLACCLEFSAYRI
jgi:hypothetical protein